MEMTDEILGAQINFEKERKSSSSKDSKKYYRPTKIGKMGYEVLLRPRIQHISKYSDGYD